MKTYLSKDQMLEALNEEEATAYVALKIMFDKMLTKDKEEIELSFTIKQLYYELSGNFHMNKYDKAKLEEGVKGLIDADVIKLIDSDEKGEYIVDVAGIKVKQNEPYTTMDREEIRAIFNLPCKQKFNLLRFAIGLFGTFNSYNGCGWASFRAMPEFTGITRVASCQEYFKLLEENNIIYVHHSDKAKRDWNGQIKNLSNVYGRPCDKKAVDKLYEERSGEQGHDFTNNLSSTKRGQISRNYNKFVKGAFNGDVLELIKDCLAFNAQPYNEMHEEAQKDMSVFDADMVAQAKSELKPHIKKLKAEDKQQELKEQKELEERRKELLELQSPSGFSFALDDDDLW